MAAAHAALIVARVVRLSRLSKTGDRIFSGRRYRRDSSASGWAPCFAGSPSQQHKMSLVTSRHDPLLIASESEAAQRPRPHDSAGDEERVVVVVELGELVVDRRVTDAD